MIHVSAIPNVLIIIFYYFSFCNWASSCVVAYMSSLSVYTGILTVVLMACTFIFVPVISRSLSSVCLFLDNQSVMHRSGSGLYIM